MSESKNFSLERLYFGLLADSSAAKSAKPGFIAHTPNVTSLAAAECLRLGRLLPPGSDERTNEMPGAFALFRGEVTDYILAKAQYNDAGFPQILYILMPDTVIQWLAGNVWTFRSLAMMDMPSFAAPRRDLAPYELHSPSSASHEEQIEALVDLLWYCQDSFKTVEGILAALVQGWPIAIINSPASLEHRLWFVQGLLSLLPVPARAAITFATHVRDVRQVQAQIKFTSSTEYPPDHFIFDWAEGRLRTRPPKDTYSRYIVSQFRLDPELVVDQTEQLARTVSWRAMQKEDLGRALAWVSRRAAVDQTVREGQPANRDMVAAILQEDPTLPDDLRQVYARHLLAFALALDEPDSVDIIPSVAITSEGVARAVVQQLTLSVNDGQAAIVYDIMRRWLLHVPEASELGWHPLLRSAARRILTVLLEQNRLQEAVRWIMALLGEPTKLQLNSVFSDLIGIAWRPAQRHTELAHAVLLLAVESLAAGQLHRMLSYPEFVRRLPEPMQTALTYLQPESRQLAPPHVLDNAARSLGENRRLPVLARLVEWAVLLRRTELVDTTVLEALLELAHTRRGDKEFESLLLHVVEDFNEASSIQVLEPPGPRVLAQLLLVLGLYGDTIAQLEFYQQNVIGPEKPEAVAQIAKEVFQLTPLQPQDLETALERLEGSQIRPEPRAMVYTGALISRRWADDQEYAARRLTTMIFNDSHLVSVIGYEDTLNLLRFYARRHSALDALRVGAALVDSLVEQGPEGAVILARAWPAITWNENVTGAALELLRRYLRGVPLAQVPDLMRFFEQKLGGPVGEALRATILMRLVMGQSGLLRLTDDVHLTTALFVDIAAIYHGGRELPPNHRLRRDLDTMTGGLSESERRQVAQNIQNTIYLVYELGRDRARKRGRTSIEDLLVQNEVAPQGGVDLLRFVGGYFTNRQRVSLNLEREAMAHVFGNRSAAMFLRETNVITRLLGGLRAAFKDDLARQVTAQALTGELASLWSNVSLYHQRRVQQQFASDCQQLADVIAVMSDRANERVLSNSGLGRQLETGQRQPQSALEALRWIYGYFARKHMRTRP